MMARSSGQLSTEEYDKHRPERGGSGICVKRPPLASSLMRPRRSVSSRDAPLTPCWCGGSRTTSFAAAAVAGRRPRAAAIAALTGPFALRLEFPLRGGSVSPPREILIRLRRRGKEAPLRGGSVSPPREILICLRRRGHGGARGQNRPYRPFAGARFSLDGFVGSSGGGGPGYFDLRAVMFWLRVHV